jgi:hypothetical protein
MPWTTATTRATGFPVTAAVWNAEVVDNMNFLREVAYTQFTSTVAITATTEGTANQIVTSGAITYEAVPHLIEFFSPVTTPVDAILLRFVLEDSTTVVGHLGRVDIDVAAASPNLPIYLVHRLTPTAATHTYNVRAYTTSGTANVQAGAGGAGALLPGFIRITRIPT